MVYVISLIVYVAVFALGMFFIHKRPATAEKSIHQMVFVGFLLQILINWGFWGNLSAFNPIAPLASLERTAINLMFLCLISIFLYSGLFVALLKSHEFYNPSES